MKYYFKVALLTLVVSVVAAELVGPRFGLQGYVIPWLEDRFAPQATTQPVSDVATLELATESAGTARVSDATSEAQALDRCVAAIKSIALHPEFTQVPDIRARTDRGVYIFGWNKTFPARTLNSAGRDVGMLATCHIERATGVILRLSVNGRALVTQPTRPADLRGSWSVQRQVSRVDNSTNVTLSLAAGQTVSMNGQRARPELILHCGENRTIAYLRVGVPVGAGTLRVRSQIGGEQSEARWSISGNRMDVRPDGRFIALIRSLMRSGDALFTLIPVQGDAVAIPFDLAGLPSAVFPLQEACHWK